ncbi:LysR family transcriptional regulator [Streptomyces populi]|uniref:LysR family transcriptional regulator n=1 Tax=Streptomyces populi TaxID=2058924 RepID=A0A2I0SC56_9ACTN|nr:LysR family transcriptional regulator [Streptomyces populi]PKT67521.1 LysR family transcriptional regulator [Streptomyces populi]
MDLRQMEVVVTVAEAGGFTAAAQRLHVVQSAVSSTVLALERELGTSLFDRTTHRVFLTPAGEVFVPAARAALRAAEQARAAVDLVRGKLRGRVTIGMAQGVWADLHRPLAALRAEHPGVTVRLRQASLADVRHGLREGTLDLAVVALDRGQQRGLVTRLLSYEEMVLVSAPPRALTGTGPDGTVTLAGAARLPLVDFTPDWAIRLCVDRAFRAAGVERETALEVDDIVTAAELVRSDLGVCVMPASIAGRFPDLVTHAFARHAPHWKIMMVHPRGDTPPAVTALLGHMA